LILKRYTINIFVLSLIHHTKIIVIYVVLKKILLIGIDIVYVCVSSPYFCGMIASNNISIAIVVLVSYGFFWKFILNINVLMIHLIVLIDVLSILLILILNSIHKWIFFEFVIRKNYPLTIWIIYSRNIITLKNVAWNEILFRR